MNKSRTSFLTRLLWLLSNNVVILLLLNACKPHVSENDMKYEKIWSKKVLSIEFLENDTIKFFTDTLDESHPYKIVFEKSHNFNESNLVDVNSVFDETLTPLSLDHEKFPT